MNQKVTGVFAAFILIFLATIACSLTPAQSPTPGTDALYTQAAQTVSAQLTVSAALTQSSPGATATGLPAVTESPPGVAETPTPTNTQAPPTPTSIPPSPTPVPPTPTPTPIPCNWAQFVEDVTVKDGTVFAPNAVFEKTWRLKNIGTCTWTRDYRLVFASGERMDGPQAISMPENIDPGETVDLSVELIAPDEPGRFRGYWQLSTPSGASFGIGADTAGTFWVEIRVTESDKYAYDFGASYCDARWRSEPGRLECPGEMGDDEGFVRLVDRPLIEKDRLENEAALVVSPQDTDDGWIWGEYPEIEIESDYRFKATVGCMDETPECDVIFQLNYRIGDGEVQTLWETREVYDDAFTRVEVDLSSLEGEEVQLILTVLANGSPEDDVVFWLVPPIVEVY
jgi:hypothetical protein